MFVTSTTKCTVNPIIGREFEASIPVSMTEPKRVVIVGGGPAGMQAAITATERGHDVMLCERSDSLGGALKCAAGVSFKADLDRFKEHLIRKINSMPIAVLLNTEITPELVVAGEPDVVIVSVGAEPIIPDIPGIRRGSVLLAADVHSPGAAVGDRVVVIGGGQVGCETGLHLAQQGRDVTVVEMLDEVAPDANIMHRRGLMLELQKAVKVRTGLRCVEITDEGVVAVDQQSERVTLAYDTVVIAVGYKPCTGAVDALLDTAPEVMTIGDCVRPRKVLQAIRTGYDAGMAI
jgi:pyruvate/2-oxoglutarate dehydrogenase complex dihydrolipoamide dehydrogenase (E3) component